MDKRFFTAWLVVFIAWFLGSFLVHGLLLAGDYARLQNLFRTPEDSNRHFHWMALAHVMLSGALVWIYSRGAEPAKGWAPQGVRFGIAAALLTVVPTYMIAYVVQPMPAGTVIKQIVFDGALVVLLGVLAAFMYRPRPA